MVVRYRGGVAVAQEKTRDDRFCVSKNSQTM